MSALDLSIVIPLFNEDESLPELTDWISRVMDREGYTYEIIFVNDGSTDNSWQVIQELRTKNENVKATNVSDQGPNGQKRKKVCVLAHGYFQPSPARD